MISNSASTLGSDLSATILGHDDPELVAQGLPAYLLLVDTLLLRDPHNKILLHTGADAYNAYASGFVDDNSRRAVLVDKAMQYADLMICEHDHRYCRVRQLPMATAASLFTEFQKSDVAWFYSFAGVWAAWIQAHSDNWDAVAQLAHVEFIMTRIVELDETYQDGGAHLYLGTLAVLVPPAMGGNPERAKFHFDRAIQLSNGENLMAKVLYAQHYARAIFDREYHDQLLHEVLEASPQSNNFTLSNAIAKNKAKSLLASADSYF